MRHTDGTPPAPRLVKREILVKTSEAQRGPSVTYGPGARFPPDGRQPETTSTLTISRRVVDEGKQGR
jgi:hypothetical protein